VIVVTAYDPDAEGGIRGGRQVLRDHDEANAVLTATVKHLTSDRVRRVEEGLVHGDPAQALLDTAADDPAALIVIGNRGLGAAESEVLGRQSNPPQRGKEPSSVPTRCRTPDWPLLSD
jgi:maltose/moltooligosaccharide transporter